MVMETLAGHPSGSGRRRGRGIGCPTERSGGHLGAEAVAPCNRGRVGDRRLSMTSTVFAEMLPHASMSEAELWISPGMV